MPELLISVRSPLEALSALEGGADWIDVKEPDNGALGKASTETLSAIAKALPPETKLSAALGDAFEFKNEGNLGEVLKSYKLAKIGTANTNKHEIANAISNLVCNFGLNRNKIAIATYADHGRAKSLSPFDLPSICNNENINYLLIDTYLKDGSGLLDWISLPLLLDLKKECHSNNIKLALAGSLKQSDIPYLLQLSPSFIGLRGSVCANGKRKNGIEKQLVKFWAQALK